MALETYEAQKNDDIKRKTLGRIIGWFVNTSTETNGNGAINCPSSVSYCLQPDCAASFCLYCAAEVHWLNQIAQPEGTGKVPTEAYTLS